MTMCEKRNGNYNIDDHVLVRVNVKKRKFIGLQIVFLKLVGYTALLKLN